MCSQAKHGRLYIRVSWCDTMTLPTISICLPNLNNAEFLHERFDSILGQSFSDWELIVVDGYSDDGAWEIIGDYCSRDQRIQATQCPREGIYAGWNECLRRTHGRFIFFATSDDTMEPDFLEKMVQGLDAHPECGLCTCCCRVIDGAGEVIPKIWESRYITRFFGALMDITHVRSAPHDGLLHCFAATVYLSITQLLIRRDVIERIGFFRTDLGTQADFEWEMRASFLFSTIHIPAFLASWRIHEKQATNMKYFSTAKSYRKYICMMRMTLDWLAIKSPDLMERLDQKLLFSFCQRKLDSLRKGASRFDELEWIRQVMDAHGALELIVKL